VARPATWRDHSEKWVRRHARLAASVGLALALVVVCAVASAVVVWRAQSETARALVLAGENHRDTRRAVDELFTGVATELAEVPGAERVRHELLHQARSYYRKFAAQAKSDPGVRAEAAAAFYRCGQISEQLGDDAAARAAYEEAQQAWSALRAQSPSDDQLRPLALCENNLGLIHLRAGRHSEAESHLRRAMEGEQELASRHPEDVEVKCDLALSYANLGMALGQAGRRDEARASLETALELQRSTASPSALARGDLAATYNQLGYLYSSTSVADAEAAYRHAADEFQRLAEAEPRVPRWQAQLATTLNNLAALAAGARRLDEAEALYRRAVELQRQLTERAPQLVAYGRDLAVSQNNFGYLLSRQNRAQEAIEQFESARTNLASLARAHDKSPEYASRLGAVCNNLGLAFESLHEYDRSQAAYREAIEWQQAALTLSPGWTQAQSYLAAHRANLVRLLRATEQTDAANELETVERQAGLPAGQDSPTAARQLVEMITDGAVPLPAQALAKEPTAATVQSSEE
jgi:eukaryotic-like serine/threonine-protein kinase